MTDIPINVDDSDIYEQDESSKLQDAFEQQTADFYNDENAEAIENQELTKQSITTDEAVKGGPGDHSWGGYEEKKRGDTPGSHIVKPANVSQEDWDNRPEWSRPLEDILYTGSAAGAGVLDFAFDAIGLVPWLKPADEWWDNNSPRSKHPANKMIRDASSVIIPSLYGGHAITGSVKSASWAQNLPKITKVLGNVAAWAGVDTTVAMISSHSKTDDNLAATLNNWLGVDIPWATRESVGPDVRWKKNVYEAAGLAGGVAGQQFQTPAAANPFATALSTALGIGGLFGKFR